MAVFDSLYADLYGDHYGTLIPITNPGPPLGGLPGPSSSVIEAVTRQDPLNPYGGTPPEQQTGDFNRSFWSAFSTDVLFLPDFTLLDADVQVTGSLSTDGLPGATAASRYVGAVMSGPPPPGTWAAGDFAIDQSGAAWVYTTSGVWVDSSNTATVVNLIDAPVVILDVSRGNDFRLAIGGNRLLANPLNPVDGQKITVEVTQPAAGGPYILTYDTQYEFGDSQPIPQLSVLAGQTDMLGFVYNATIGNWLFVSFIGGFANTVLLVNGFAGGISGTSITTGNSGGISGNAFDSVTIASGGTMAFSNVQTLRPSGLSLLCQTTTANSSNVTWSTSWGTQSKVWFRLYLYFASLPAGNTRIFGTTATGTSGATSRITITTAGKLQAQDIAGQTTITTNTVPTGTWFRVEGFIAASLTVGQTEVKLFTTTDGTVPLETNTSAATKNTGPFISATLFGPQASAANQGPFYMDDIGVSSTGYLGPTTGTGIVTGAAALTGSSALTPAGVGAPPGRAVLTGAGVLTAAGAGLIQGPPITLTGYGGHDFQSGGIPSYTGIAATFTVPSLTIVGTHPGAVCSIWVGLGNVQQTGIFCYYDATKSGNCRAQSWTWYLPAAELWNVAAFPVSAGDVMTLSLSYDSNYWYARQTNTTQGWDYTETKSIQAANVGGRSGSGQYLFPEAEAKIIIEKEGTFDLPNYGTVAFTNIQLTPFTGTDVAITTQNSVIDQTPGVFSGTAFTMTWQGYA